LVEIWNDINQGVIRSLVRAGMVTKSFVTRGAGCFRPHHTFCISLVTEGIATIKKVKMKMEMSMQDGGKRCGNCSL
jgi:hypothetical protein